ncbi:unnamed protein product [Clonostachys rhizophaga]|uniref:Uncharacterized protein n=1 Tax=Clonostachys rhizophaga TaxID=160324 RepID=A0A9N9VH25_9HYPO|nr:unnamed protein product [Clonostachys rhizophaga]
MLENSESVRHRIFRYSPLLCGLYLFFFRACFSAIALREDSAPIIACAHIYHALRKEKLLDCCWPDMDTAIELLGDNSFWEGGKRPKTTHGPSGFTSYKRKIHSQAGTSFGFPMDTIRPSEPLRNKTHQMHGATLNREEYVWTPAEVKNLLVGRPGAVRRSWQERRFLESNDDKSPSTRGLLASILSYKLYNETLDLAFPYPRVHRQSRTLLMALCETFKTIIPPESEILVQTDNLPFIIVAIFQLSIRPEPEHRETLSKAAAVVNAYLSAGEGSACVVAAAEAGLPFKFASPAEEGGDASIDAEALD